MDDRRSPRVGGDVVLGDGLDVPPPSPPFVVLGFGVTFPGAASKLLRLDSLSFSSHFTSTGRAAPNGFDLAAAAPAPAPADEDGLVLELNDQEAEAQELLDQLDEAFAPSAVERGGKLGGLGGDEFQGLPLPIPYAAPGLRADGSV